MRNNPRQNEKNDLIVAGRIAQQRLAMGVRLNIPESTALLSAQIILLARTGGYSVARLMAEGRTMLGKRQVIPGTESVVKEIQVEATFADGTKLVTLHHPIAREQGNLDLALWGSFLPTPSVDAFADHPEDGLIPGELLLLQEAHPTRLRSAADPFAPVVINANRSMAEIFVQNTSDRPIQVGSHYHFIETNAYLRFDRRASYGMRLNIAAGTSVRFEPGSSKIVSLVSIAGNKIVRGGNSIINGPVSDDPLVIDAVVSAAVERGFLDASEEVKARTLLFPEYAGLSIERGAYTSMFGPTVGDIVRLADTELYIRVERDLTVYGDECKFGGGKVLREGMGQATGVPLGDQLDTVITNALIVDHSGIYKADIGIKDGKISGIGKAGNPDVMHGVTPGMVCGVNTEAIAAEGLIVTAGGVDSHVHFICPQICDEALSSGVTTLIGGGTGPASGSCATTCTPGPWHMRRMMEATDEVPINFGFTGKGNTSSPVGLVDIINGGAIGMKLHEDWGTTPAAIDNCLTVADLYDVQVTIHTDTLNESSCVEHTIAAFKGRTIHTYHTEGAGGGHAPDIMRVVSLQNVIPSSTNPTRPLTCNTMDEHLDMLMVCHHLDSSIPEDVAFAESRIRRETIAAEDIAHDIGAISIISSDSQAMGRAGEVILRTWQTADKMKRQRGQLSEDTKAEAMTPLGPRNKAVQTDNFRVRRYIAKYTINPCVAHGVADIIGSVEVGKLADLVLWKPEYFGVRPELTLKGGFICHAQMGDANASIPTPQPVFSRPMFGAMGRAAARSSLLFVSKSSIESGIVPSYGLSKPLYAVRNCRTVGKSDMVLNDATPDVNIDPETFRVTADGVHLTCEAATVLPMAHRFFMS